MSRFSRWWKAARPSWWRGKPPEIAGSQAPLAFAHREPMRISEHALAGMLASDGGNVTLVDTYRVIEPPAGVLPDGVTGAKIAMDAGWDPGTAIGYAQSIGFHEGIGFQGFAYLSELTQRPEYRRGSETMAKEMTREWIKLSATGDDDKTAKVAELEAALDDFKVQDLFRQVAEHDGFFGRAHIYIDTGASDDPVELMTPLVVDKRKIAKGSLDGLRVVEPIWCYPAVYNAAKPLRDDFYRPRGWYVMGQEVHRTRLLTFVGREMPDILKPAYSFAGLSLSQMAKPYVDNWLRTRQSVSDLVHAFSVMVLSTNMGAVLNGGSSVALMKRAMMFSLGRDNKGLMMVDKDTEELSNVSAPLSGLDHLQAQSQEQLSSVFGIPLVKLLGITPSGLNASSDGEIRVFYDWIGAQQEHLFGRHLRTIMDVLMIHLWGDVDPDITFAFEPLWQLDDAAKAVIRKTDADTDVELINAGVLHPEESRQRVAEDEGSPYAGLDVDDVPDPPIDPNDPSLLPDPATGAEPRAQERSGD